MWRGERRFGWNLSRSLNITGDGVGGWTTCGRFGQEVDGEISEKAFAWDTVTPTNNF